MLTNLSNLHRHKQKAWLVVIYEKVGNDTAKTLAFRVPMLETMKADVLFFFKSITVHL